MRSILTTLGAACLAVILVAASVVRILEAPASARDARMAEEPEDSCPVLLDLIERRELDLLINTPIHSGSATEEGRWRAASIRVGIPLITTLAGARAAVGAIRAMKSKELTVAALQDYLEAGRSA